MKTQRDQINAAKQAANQLNGEIRHAHRLACDQDNQLLEILLRGLIGDAVKLQDRLAEIENALPK